MKKDVLILVFIVWGLSGFSQFSDSIFYRVNYTSSGNYNRTNTNESYILNNTLNLNYRKKPLMVDFGNKWLYGEQQKRRVNNDFSSVLEINLFKSLKHFYYWGICVYTKSYSLKINNQLQTGAGVAYSIIDKVNFKLNISDGLLYEYSDQNIQDTLREVYETPRNSLRLQAKYYYKSLISFSGTFYIQNSLKSRQDIIYKSDVDLGIKLKRWLSVTAKLTYNKISRTKRENLFITFGLSFEKYF